MLALLETLINLIRCRCLLGHQNVDEEDLVEVRQGFIRRILRQQEISVRQKTKSPEFRFVSISWVRPVSDHRAQDLLTFAKEQNAGNPYAQVSPLSQNGDERGE